MKESKGCFRLGSNPFFVKVLQIWHVYIVFEVIVTDNELRGKVMERAFAMLAELLQQEQFELLISEEDQTDHSVETDIRLVYLMNDAVESFLVFKEAKMTGKYLRDYEGMLDATLSKEEETYILTVWQDDQALTIFFKQLELVVHLYEYGEVAHFWVPGYEYLRLLEYQIAILRDKYDYLGENYCTDIEKKLAQLADFPPLNDTCYPAVPEKYLVPRVNGWRPTKAAIDVMIELAGEVNDRSMIRNLKLYRKCHGRWMTRKIAGMLCQTIHQQLIVLISEKMQEGTRHYSKRIFDEKIEDEFNRRLKQAVKRQQKLIASGIRALVYREEPFTTAKDSLEFHVYLMIDEKCRKNRKVRIEEVR